MCTRPHPRRPVAMLLTLLPLVLVFSMPVPSAAKARRKVPLLTNFAANTKAHTLHVVDADSVWFEIPGQGRLKTRLYGINAPECRKRQVHKGTFHSAYCVKDKEYFGLAAYKQLHKLIA